MNKSIRFLPLFLSSFRLVIACTVWPFLVMDYACVSWSVGKVVSFVLFVLLCLSDFFDGFFARRFNCTSRLGAFLDHFADKVLVISSLIPLVYMRRIYFFGVLLILLRELYILALRHAACSLGIEVSVRWWGKLKAWFQFVYLMVVFCCSQTSMFEEFLFLIVVLVTVISAGMYTGDFMQKIKGLRL